MKLQGAMEKFGKPVYIIPCGLNYFHGHRFRGNCLLEFGRAYKIPMSMVKLYKENKRQACTQLLKLIKEFMETVCAWWPSLNFCRLSFMHPIIRPCKRLSWQGNYIKEM
jgi:glycerol-3-phosphate O-acyltransferase/dihydroxyacetone phosphate acyltransferase